MRFIWGLFKHFFRAILALLVICIVWVSLSFNTSYGVKKEIYACSFDYYKEVKLNFSPYIYPEGCDFLKRKGDKGLRVVIKLLSQLSFLNAYKSYPDTSIYFFQPLRYIDGKYIPSSKIVDINKKSIHLSYITAAGKILRPEEESLSNIKDGSFVYKQRYQEKDFSLPVKVHVSFDMLLDGKLVHIEKDFKLEGVIRRWQG
jgi:hypothetical protein